LIYVVPVLDSMA
jgi:superfamily II DNA helicase RecQ